MIELDFIPFYSSVNIHFASAWTQHGNLTLPVPFLFTKRHFMLVLHF